VKYFPATTATLFLGVTSKNEQVKQIQVNFFLFKTSVVNSWHHGFIFRDVLQVYLSMCPIFQQVCECSMQKRSRLLCKPLMNGPLHCHIWGKFLCTQHFLHRAKNMIVTGCISLWIPCALCPLAHKKTNNSSLLHIVRVKQQCCSINCLLMTS